MFIVLEGSDGSGKTTQFKLLAERLRAAGHEVDTYDFPRYEEPSSYFVKRYLNGEYGPASEVSPYTASLFYALDRFEAAPLIRQSLAEDKIVLANRYTGSNMAHQGAKFPRAGEQRGFFVWADSLEFQLLGIPRPTINIFLRVPAEAAYKLIKQKPPRGYTSKNHDEHEADIDHLRQAVSAYDTLCQLFSKDFQAIDCTKNMKILSITEVNNRIWSLIKPLLPSPKHAGRSAVISLNEKPGAKSVSSSPRRGVQVDKQAADNNSRKINDISLLSLHKLIGQGLDIDYSLKWPPDNSKTKLHFFIPSALPAKLTDKYRTTMTKLIENGRKINKALPEDARKYTRYITPLATLVDTRVSGTEDEIRSLIKSSLIPMAEQRQLTKQVRVEMKEPAAVKQIIDKIGHPHLGTASSGFSRQIKLVNAAPKNEFDLLAEHVYQHSNLTHAEIMAQIDQWTYEQKAAALKSIVKSDTKSLLGKINYRFDVLDSLIDLESITEAVSPTEIQIQSPTPRYGYRVPQAIDQSGASEIFLESFDLSLELNSDIQAAGYEDLAGYSVLLGHRQRWQFICTGESVFYTGFQLPAIKSLLEQIAITHPLIFQTVNDVRHRKLPDSNKPPASKEKLVDKDAKKQSSKSKK